MTNADIIYEQQKQLYNENKIKTTGRLLVVKTDDGKEIQIPEFEPIHTFLTWKELGFKIKKGEHAIAKFAIWKYTSKENEKGEETDAHCFLKMSNFFSKSQVEKMGV